jgi:transposase
VVIPVNWSNGEAPRAADASSQPSHPHPEGSQGGVREVAIAGKVHLVPRCLRIVVETSVGVEKVTVISERSGGRSVVKGNHPSHACWITIVGGTLIMMGQHSRSEALFYYFRLEDQVPANHLLRLIDKHISFAFVREKLEESYSDTGRPSIDPELLLRILLIGYLYGITSERKLVEELRTHLAWRWFTGLGFDQEIPHHSTFSKNRHGRFQESKVFEQLFEEIVARCLEAGLVQGRASAAHPVDRLSVRRNQRTETGRGTAHASGVALVHRSGVRSGDSAPLYIFQESARTIPRVEAVRAVV